MFIRKRYAAGAAGIAALCALLFTFINLSQWELSNLYTDDSFSDNGLEKVLSYDPEKSVASFPKINDQNFFASIDDFSICRRKEVRYYIYRYLTIDREYTIRSLNRSFMFLPILEEQFENNNDIPDDLKYLPLLESGFEPNAVSSSNAMGLWQFIAGTAKDFALKNDNYLDERRDIEKSTDSAIRHLRHLYSLYNNWELALAAYNGGQGYVNEVIKKNGTSDFWKLCESNSFRKETNEYLPRFAALLIIAKNYRSLNIRDQVNDSVESKTIVIDVSAGDSLKSIAERHSLSYDLVKRYNPELKTDAIPPYYPTYQLRLPEKGYFAFNR